jgi:hypothetical protein
LCAQSELRGLEFKIGELSTGDFMYVNFVIWTLEIGLKARIEKSHLSPVFIERADMLYIETCR